MGNIERKNVENEIATIHVNNPISGTSIFEIFPSFRQCGTFFHDKYYQLAKTMIVKQRLFITIMGNN
jgi:hypothetical protein